MTNQEAFEAARAGDWIAESFTRSGDVFIISGKSAGYSSFDDCLSNGDSVFYSAFDEADNREAGLAVWDSSAKTLTPVEIHASLVGGAFIKGDPEAVKFSNGGTITGTLNATAFNTIWGHVFEKGNPHETEAYQIDQSNENLGDNVQEALDSLSKRINDNVEDIEEEEQEIQDHLSDLNNPHEVTAPQVELDPKSVALGDNVQESLEMMLARYQELAGDLVLTNVDGNETVIQIRRGPTSENPPTPDQIDVGELSFDYDDGHVYSKLSDGTIVVIGSVDHIKDAPRDSYIYGRKGGVWTRITPTLISDEPPAGVDNGTLWFDTGTTGELYVYDGTWISVTGGNGGLGENDEIPDNIVLDDADAILRDVALVREINEDGDGEWRPVYAGDIMAEGDRPMFRDSTGRFTKADAGNIRTQKDANWYLNDRIVDGIEKQDELEGKIKALEGAVGEHSLMFTMGEIDGPQFSISDEMSTKNRLSEASFITLPTVDRNGSAIALERISQGDVLRMGDGVGEFTELRINGEPQGNTFPYNQISGDMDRLTDSIPYDFTVFVAFDPAGLATTDYVDTAVDSLTKKTNTWTKTQNFTGITSSGTQNVIDVKGEYDETTERWFKVRGSNRLNFICYPGQVNESYKSVMTMSWDEEAKAPKASLHYLEDPKNGGDAASKKYVDDRVLQHSAKIAPLWRYRGLYQDGNKSLKDGEFKISIDESKKQMTLYIAERNAYGKSWFVSGEQYQHVFDRDHFMGCTDKDADLICQGLAGTYRFAVGDDKHAELSHYDYREKHSFYYDNNYYLNIPGLLPAQPFENYFRTHPAPKTADAEVSE